METENLKLSQDDLIIKILEFVCQNKNIRLIYPQIIKARLLPNIELVEIENLFKQIEQRKEIPVGKVVYTGGKHNLKHNPGLEEYVKNYKRMNKRQKLHRIVEFLSMENTRTKEQSFDSGQIAKAFDPELNIHEVNRLCEIIIAKDDLNKVLTDQSYASNMLEVVVTPRTHSAFETKKYLEEDEDFIVPTHQTIVTADNLSYVGGDNYGEVKQKDHSPKRKVSRKLKLWEIVLMIIAGLAGIVTILHYVFRVF